MLKFLKMLKNNKEADKVLAEAQRNLEMAKENLEVDELRLKYVAACDDCLSKYYELMGVTN